MSPPPHTPAANTPRYSVLAACGQGMKGNLEIRERKIFLTTSNIKGKVQVSGRTVQSGVRRVLLCLFSDRLLFSHENFSDLHQPSVDFNSALFFSILL